MSNILKYLAFFAIAVGLFFGKYIGRWLMYKFDPPKMINSGESYSNTYMSSCDTIHLYMTGRKDTSSYFEVRSSFNGNSDLSTAHVDKFESVFFDKGQKKYFKIIYFFPVNSIFSDMYRYFLNALHENEKNNEIVAKVNGHDLGDSGYGTETNPIPILSYAVPNLGSRFYDSIKGEKGETRYFSGTEAEFEAYQLNFNVKYYLSYVMPKKEFEERFGKKE